MSATQKKEIADRWDVPDEINVPQTWDAYNNLVATLNVLIDEVGEDESHRLAPTMEKIGRVIEEFEDSHVPELHVRPELEREKDGRWVASIPGI